MLSLAGKECIITGGSRGIGLAIARLFALHGATCTLVGRDSETLAEAATSLSSKDSSQQHGVAVFNVANAQEWTDLIMRDWKDKRLDILVNAAGVSQNAFLFKSRHIPLQKIIQTNLMGTVWGCQNTIPKMMRQKDGCIINVSSLLASHGGRGASVYAASKAGVVALTRSLAWEVGRFGIRANVLMPGYIQTDMTKGDIPPFLNLFFLLRHPGNILLPAVDRDQNGELSALIPMGRLGLAEEVADAALFLAKNPYAHNCVLNIDGGLSAT
ncbi:NAD(P)-binding protein [Hypomontagnella monticulosa]|nr:NAD(P)-binding protein [Hypomontagnella monticulosa]